MPYRTTPSDPFVIRHEGALTCAVLFVAMFLCGLLGMAS